jgi:hypothetical protein
MGESRVARQQPEPEEQFIEADAEVDSEDAEESGPSGPVSPGEPGNPPIESTPEVKWHEGPRGS